MKKLLLCLFAILFTTNVYAGGIAADATSATCDNATLDAYNGTVSLEVNWIPNDINIRYYDNNTLITPTNNAANTCAYSGDLVLPTTPSRTGYTFKGWELRPEMDFSTLDDTIDGTSNFGTAKVQNSDTNICVHDAVYESCDVRTDYADLKRHEWKVEFTYGTIYGMGMCSEENFSSNTRVRDDISNTLGSLCWCKATGFKASGGNIVYGPSSTLPWVAYADGITIEYCLYRCASYCGGATKSNKYEFRPKIFGK